MSRSKKNAKPDIPTTGKSGKPDLSVPGAKVRVDKWLWAARFFKTRTLATEQVEGYKVKCNGARIKPAYGLQVGDMLTIPRGWDEMEVKVTALAEKRGSAAVAATLYEETAESLTKRQQRAENRALVKDPSRGMTGRPTKRDRRDMEKVRWENDG